MKKHSRTRERGFSLVVALLALMLISAIAIGMMFVSSTETSISTNFRSEETAYFAARAGVEEVRDRMLPSPPSPSGSYSVSAALPTVMPGAGSPWALYILNGKNQSGVNVAMSDVTSFSSGNQLVDDELCHDFYNANTGMTYRGANVKCTNLPTGSAWYGTAVQSLQPVGGASNPIDYKWIRVTLKANNTYAGNNPNTQLLVDPAQPGTNQVCWSGSGAGAHEIVVAAGTSCVSANAEPVYLLTALALTQNGARRIVQQEVAQTFIPFNVPGGMFAAGTGCSALGIAGNAQTGSFNSVAENPPTNPPSNLNSSSGGDVGSNGNISLGGSSTRVNGNINTNDPPSVGSCPGNGVTVSGNPQYNGIASASLYSPAVPPAPNPLPPTSNVTWRNVNEPAGSYGNVTVKGTVTLTGGTKNNPAVFTMNSLTLNGNADLQISGYVILNLAGVGVSNVLDMTGGGFTNNSYVPSSFVINYGGTDSMTITGGTAAYAAINAPNSPVTLRGGSNFYGQIIAQTISDQGGTNFYWDSSMQVPPPSNTTTFHDVALRELSY